MAEGQDQGQPTGDNGGTQPSEGTPKLSDDFVGKQSTAGSGKTTTATSDTTQTWQQSGRKGNFTQEDLNRATGNARQEGRERALNDLAKEVGASGIDAVKAAMQAHKESEDARLDELGKLQKTHEKVAKERDTFRSEIEALNGRLVAVQRSQALQVSLIEAGVNPERVAAVSRLVDHDALEVDDNGKVGGLEEAIASARELAPELFVATTRSVGAPGGNPPGDPPEAKDDIWSMPSDQFAAYKKRALQGDLRGKTNLFS